MHVKVAIRTARTHHYEQFDLSERSLDDMEDAEAAGFEPQRPKPQRPQRRVTPAEVIARSITGRNEPAPRPATLIAEALAPAAQGADNGFWDVWLAHRDFLRAQALRFSSGNLSDAEDAMSEAMLKAANAFSKTNIHNQRGWLMRLVHNACMDHHRNNRRQNRLANDIGHSDAQSAPAIAIQPDRTPEDLLIAMQKVGDIHRALGSLPKFLAEPLILHLDEHSDAEIADNLNVTKEVVRKRRQMARALLRRQMDG